MTTITILTLNAIVTWMAIIFIGIRPVHNFFDRFEIKFEKKTKNNWNSFEVTKWDLPLHSNWISNSGHQIFAFQFKKYRIKIWTSLFKK